MTTATTKLRVLQIREEPASHGVTFPVQMRNLVTTEIRDHLSNDDILANMIKLPIEKRGVREMSLFRTSLKARKSADVLILGQGTALRMAAFRALQPGSPKMVVISYDPFPFCVPGKVLSRKEQASFFVRRQLYESLDGLLVHSTGQVELLKQEMGLRKVYYVPMAIDLDRFSPAETPRGDSLLLTDGALRDYETLASAVELMRTKPKELIVVHRNQLTDAASDALVRIRDAGTKVQLRFRISQDELIDLYRTCMAVVIPIAASYQPAGLTQMLEAAAVGCPIASTGGAFLDEYLRDGIEVLSTPPGDAPKLAGSLEELVTNPGTRTALSRAAYERACIYNFDDSLDVLRAVLKSLP